MHSRVLFELHLSYTNSDQDNSICNKFEIELYVGIGIFYTNLCLHCWYKKWRKDAWVPGNAV